MNEGIGAKGGKKDRKLSFLNKKRKIQLKNEELFQAKEKEKQQKEKQKEEEIVLNHEKPKEFKQQEIQPKDLNKEDIVYKKPLEDITVMSEKEPKEIKKKSSDEVIEISTSDKENDILPYKKRKKKGKKEPSTTPLTTPFSKEIAKEEKYDDIEDYLEKQVIKVLEQDIKEKKYLLKKIDSEIHTIQKSIDSTNDEEELAEIEKEIERLIDIVEQLKRQILSLEKTFDFKFPVEEPDNYLIYLVEEYKAHRKEEKEFYKKLQENDEFKSLIDTIIEIEEKQEMVQEKMKNKKEQLDLEEEQVEKLNNDVLDIEEINQTIEKMIEEHEAILEEIKQNVNETVHITERVEFISKSVNHTMLELFLLMAMLKHNLSIKNNAIAAATAALILDMIIKMTTPIQEKVIVKDCDIEDYETMIRNCMNDTGFLERMIGDNLNQISSIRYTFEKEYSSCSYLPSYQEAMEKLTTLEEEMVERKDDVARMKKEMELQLEKNNAKVKKYGSITAA